eukprot:6599503-Pyramimonas_sp.AAC.1
MTGSFLARLRAGEVPGLGEFLRKWRASVLARVGTVQFDAAEEVGRQLGMVGDERMDPLPLSEKARAQAFADGKLEEDDVAVHLRTIAGASRGQLEKLCKKRREEGRQGAPSSRERRGGELFPK